MSERLATSILESPYNYNSAQQAIRKRKREGGGSNFGTSSNHTQELFGDNILDQSYTSHNSNMSFTGLYTNGMGTAEKPSFNVSEEGKMSEKVLDSNPSTPQHINSSFYSSELFRNKEQ